jgi:hypothetical protein
VSTSENIKYAPSIMAMPSVGFSEFATAFNAMLSPQSKNQSHKMHGGKDG